MANQLGSKVITFCNRLYYTTLKEHKFWLQNGLLDWVLKQLRTSDAADLVMEWVGLAGLCNLKYLLEMKPTGLPYMQNLSVVLLGASLGVQLTLQFL